MEIVLSPCSAPLIRSGIVNLGGLYPLVNGQPLPGQPSRHWQADGRLYFEYPLDQPQGGDFRVEIQQISSTECVLRYSVSIGAADLVLDRFGIGFSGIDYLRQYLCHGYHSWDGSFYVDPAALADWGDTEVRPETGHAMTQLLPREGAGSLVLGFDRHDRFQQTFTFNTRLSPPGLVIETLWDQKDRHGLERCQSEQLLIFEHPAVEGALREWARRVVSASPITPRQVPPIKGWCSWYNLYNAITEENILQHLEGVRQVTQRDSLPLQVFQIDDGFTPEMGDWLEVKPQFPRGMRPLLDDIRAAGFTPGLWIAPFLVGNRSHLFRDHPDWVLRQRSTGEPLAHMKLYGEFRWGKRSEEYYILDASHPAALAYLRQVFRTWRQEWGCEYFKTDFMYFGCAYDPERVRYHIHGLTRIETWRSAAELIRSEIGDALWTGCGCPLWAAVGLVDGMRIGRDVGVEWSGNQSAQSLLRDQVTRNFTNGIFWQTDPDCILLRQKFHNLTDNEVTSLALFAGMSGGLLMTSDALEELPPDRLALWKMILNMGQGTCDYPLLGRSEVVSRAGKGKSPHELQAADPVVVQVRRGQPGMVFIFNTGDEPVARSFALSELGLLVEGQSVVEWNGGLKGVVDTLQVELPAHGGRLFVVGEELR